MFILNVTFATSNAQFYARNDATVQTLRTDASQQAMSTTNRVTYQKSFRLL
jgi:hypothetical protein